MRTSTEQTEAEKFLRSSPFSPNLTEAAASGKEERLDPAIHRPSGRSPVPLVLTNKHKQKLQIRTWNTSGLGIKPHSPPLLQGETGEDRLPSMF